MSDLRMIISKKVRTGAAMAADAEVHPAAATQPPRLPSRRLQTGANETCNEQGML
jgi:hypothetical protein